MSRSRKKSPFNGMRRSKTLKIWKAWVNRRSRSSNNQELRIYHSDDSLYLTTRNIERGNVWSSPRDGRALYFGDMGSVKYGYLPSDMTMEELLEYNHKYYNKWMRK